MGGGKGGGTQKTVSEPWSAAQPYLKDIMGQAQQLYQTGGPQFYPGATYLAPTAGQIGSWDTALGYADRVFGGQQTPQFGAASNALNTALAGGGMGQLAGGYGQAAGTALGNMLSGTPDYGGIQASIEAANAPILRQFEQQLLPSLNQRATFLNNPTGGYKVLSQALPDIAERMSENAIMATEGERQRALQAQQAGLGMYGQFAQGATEAGLRGAALFPTLAQAGQYPGQLQQQFANFGAGFQQQALQDQMDRFNFAQLGPLQNLQNYNSLIQGYGGLGGTASQTQPGGSRLAGAAGGALSGAAMGSVIPGLGTAAGAIIGGLGGLLG
jgi:hypothetical protein